MLRNTSAYATYGNTLLLLDCGETVFETLFRKNLLCDVDTIFLAITHFHSDHIGSIGSLVSYCNCVLHKKVFLYYPTRDLLPLLKMIGLPNHMYEYTSVVPSDFPFKLEPVEVRHDPMIKCYGYYITDLEGSEFYGGDSAEIPTEVLEKLRHGNISHIYQDTTYEFNSQTDAHGSLYQLAESVEPDIRNHITCMHFGHDFTSEIRRLGFIPATAEV